MPGEAAPKQDLINGARQSSINSLVSRSSAYTLLLLVFVLGLCSAIISLVATSWLQANKLSAVQEDVIVDQLDNSPSPIPITEINQIVNNASLNPPSVSAVKRIIDAQLSNQPSTAVVDLLQRFSDQVNQEEEKFNNFITVLTRFQAEHNEIREENSTYIKERAPAILLDPAYSSQQRRIYRLGLNSYHDKLTRQVDVIVSDVNPSVRTFNSNLRTNVSKVHTMLLRGTDITELSIGSTFQNSERQDVLDIIERGTKRLQILREKLEPPKISASVSNWGIVGIPVTWLVKPSSIELLYIAGMIAFGILGSSLTTFVTANTYMLRDPGIKDVISVVIKGVTAAIVVYLFIFGGFEVFSASEATPFSPNVYMLFLTCFLGAVYSDRIWRYAETRLVKQLREQQGGGEEAKETSSNNSAKNKAD